MTRAIIDRLDGPVADALAALRLRPQHGGERAEKQLTTALSTLIASGQLEQEDAARVTDFFKAQGALSDADKWAALQRKLDARARTSAADVRWQGDKPFASKLDATLPPKKRIVAEHVYSAGAKEAILKNVDREGMPFFELYADLRRLELGATPPDAVASRLDQVILAVTRASTEGVGNRFSPGLMNRIYQQVQDIKARLSELTNDRSHDKILWAQIGRSYRGLLIEVAEQRGLHLTPSPATESRTPAVRERAWGNIRLMSPAEKATEKLQREHPDLYEQKKFRSETYAIIDQRIVDRILEEDLVPSKARIFGKIVHLGTHGDKTYVFDEKLAPSDNAPTVDKWVRDRKRELAAEKRRGDSDKLSIDPKTLRSVSKTALGRLAKESPEIEMVALTDDRAKQNGQTRVLPTRWFTTKDGVQERVIVSGRFAGVFLDDMINSHGRMLEGTAYRLSPGSKKGVQIPSRINPGTVEPYVTVAELRRGKRREEMMLLQVPFQTGSWTTLRRTVRQLSKQIPDIRYKEGTRNTSFYFEPRYFDAVREALGGSLLLSPAATDKLSTYFDDLTRLNRAMASDNLDFYSPDAIGGFRKQIELPGGKKMPLKFHAVQQRILARLEANDNRGVVGLGTGGGKTLIAIAMMQKLIRDGVQGDPDSNGKFLYVCPEGQAGNVRSEVQKFLRPKEADFLLRNLDVVEYSQLKNHSAADYVALIFDEAQALKNEKWVATRAAYKIDHPRKILMTASVMDKADPREVYNLVQIANNVDMTDPTKASVHWSERRKFEDRYADRIGGVVVGPTRDEVARQEYEAWVNKNVQYIDKTKIPEAPLPELTRQRLTVKMAPSIEKAYKQKLHNLKVPMRGAIALHADGGRLPGKNAVNPAAKDPRAKRLLNGGHEQRVALLDTLANTPWKVYPRAGAVSPKIEAAIKAMTARLEETDNNARSIIFAEKDREFLMATGQRMSEELPGRLHVVCTRKEIHIFKDGAELETYGEHKLPFSKQAYRANPEEEESDDNPIYGEDEWRQFVIEQVIMADPEILTVAMEAQQYGTGLNLQHGFNTVMHLDRVDSEKMNQRLGRVWRNGQQDPVKEITIDVVLSGRRDKYRTTLDDMRHHVQENQARIFDDLIIKPQSATLGTEWTGMEHRPASMIGLSRKVIDLLATPMAAGIRRPDFLKDES
jgi:hypothetical protein